MRARSEWKGIGLWFLVLFCTSTFSIVARAEKTLAKDGDWVIYTDGRAGAFISYVNGQGRPLGTFAPDGTLIHDVKGGGLDAATERQPVVNGAPGELTQGTINDMRIRSGFIANTLGIGIRGPATPYTTATAYIQIWALAETDGRLKNRPNIVDVRQAYAKFEGPWGSFLAGRSRALFSRGATDIDVLYAHRWGLGYPGSVVSNGPTAGHIGFGVLGSGFAPGLVYATPILMGLQLTVGAYDPIQIPAGGWTRTRWARPEFELTFERALGNVGKIVLFGNGAWQKLYRDGSVEDETAAGVGYGGRLELGPARLGVAGHYGKGLGLTYALESSDANSDVTNNIRYFDGYYVQTQLVLGPQVDISAGWGISRVFLTTADNIQVPNADPTTGSHFPHSIIKYQMGYSAGVVFHLRPWLHVDIDFFRADFRWFLSERQVVNVGNAGMTMNW